MNSGVEPIIQSQPVESRTRVRFSAGRHVTVSGNVPRRDVRITLADRLYDGNEMPVLLVGIGRFVLTFEFDADGEIVTAGAAAKTGLTGVPGAPPERHKLHNISIAADQQVR